MNQEEAKYAIYSEFADDEEFQELIELFVNAIPHKREQLSLFHNSNDIEHLQRIAHQLKGAAGGYGFPGLTDVSASLESACKNNSLEDLDEKVNELLEYLFRISM
jgi:histidine phosphotransfer protein HptB